jgi:hypothetical protein
VFILYHIKVIKRCFIAIVIIREECSIEGKKRALKMQISKQKENKCLHGKSKMRKLETEKKTNERGIGYRKSKKRIAAEGVRKKQ